MSTDTSIQSAQITKAWWKELVAYQIYPRSFMDSNGDGIGDLNGITSKLDYLKELGIGLIWICPMYSSPNADNGYDISDYHGIMEEFGTMDDFDRLLSETHKRGMKLILDLVPNHTSDEHAWFEESRASKYSPKRDWYTWRDKHEINNWESIFKGSIWKHDALTDQYYLHFFADKQPDLNWENPEVRDAMCDMINWWLDKGIDGFRIDAISVMKKIEGLPDLPNPDGLAHVPAIKAMMNADGILDYVDEMCTRTFNKRDVVTVGEASGVDTTGAIDWVGEKHQRLNMIFQFEHMGLWQEDEEDLDIINLKKVFKQWQQGLHGIGWNSLFIENHDFPRNVSTWGDDGEFWRESATAIAAMYFLMQGTPFIYQGQEIAMTNTRYKSEQDFDCILMKNRFKEMKQQGFAEHEIVGKLGKLTRDNSRTPMQWNDSEFAGFSTGQTWMPVNQNYNEINVEQQTKQPNSVLNFYKQLINLRNQSQALIYGDFNLVDEENPRVFAYTRAVEGEAYLIISNLSKSAAELKVPDDIQPHRLKMANYSNANDTPLNNKLALRPYEARVYQL